MFVCSIKVKKKNIMVGISVLCIISIVITCVSIICFNKFKNMEIVETVMKKYDVKANNNEDRIAFLSQFGWMVEEKPLEICELEIPQHFNETYENYNNIQISQDMDLNKYKGKTCKKISYRVTNYPTKDSQVRANILVYKNKVIGGDISAETYGGFMHGFINDTSTAQSITSNALDSCKNREVIKQINNSSSIT